MTPAQEFEAVSKWYPTVYLRQLIQRQRRKCDGFLPEAAAHCSPLDTAALGYEVPFRCSFRRAIRWAVETPDVVWEKVLRDNHVPEPQFAECQ
jgi:hypothetical protein